ncbi:MAG TPA: SET domain-containing protein-lysine N-methyltransferase [Myxococcaceae bacterium]|nr:SET domain-containing protein-lysine N-methyltransferase [Myxococcaceae bacterium]
MPPSTSKKPSSRKLATLSPQPFELRSSPIQGQGAFATRSIRKGARIIEYVGERITQAEADARYDDTAMSRHHTFLFNVDEDTVIDAAHEGNDARFINHSCNPNCQAFLEGDRVYIYSKRDISEGEELSYDYGYERTEDMGPEEDALYVCRCGAPNCRGTILAPVKPESAPKKAKKKTVKKAKKATKATKKGSVKSGRSGSKVGSRTRSALG